MKKKERKKGKAADVCLLPIISRFGHFPAHSGGSLYKQHHIRAGLCCTAARGEERGMQGAEICWAGRMRSQQNQAVLMARNQTSPCALTFIVWGRRESCHCENVIRMASRMGSRRRGFVLRVHAVGWGSRAASLAALSRAVSAGCCSSWGCIAASCNSAAGRGAGGDAELLEEAGVGSRGEMLSWRARLSAVALPLPQNRGAQEVLSLRWEAAPHPATGCTASSGG